MFPEKRKCYKKEYIQRKIFTPESPEGESHKEMTS